MENMSLWVFGYGSLCWNPGFEFDRVFTGYVQGFSRKFWQGNTTHRGVEGKPGRVATIVEERESLVWGKAFRLTGEAALQYLNTRECVMGGYKTQIATFHPRSDREEEQDDGFPVLIYVARPDNHLWLGDASLTEIANQIVASKGASGHNVEYLLRLAHFMHETIPEAEDAHLFTLEFLVLTRIKEQNLSLKFLMGEMPHPDPPPEEADDRPDIEPVPEVRQNTFQFTSRVPPKKLRCLNI